MSIKLVDYHVHGLGHGEGNYTLRDLGPFVERAREAGIVELGFCEHEWLAKRVDFGLVRRDLARAFPTVSLKVGVELDYRPGRERELELLLKRYPFDYAIGSVHHVENFPFDDPAHLDGYKDRDIEKLYRDYFALLKKAAAWGRTAILGHLDLVKVFGYRCRQPLRPLLEPVLNLAACSGLLVEVNTGGLRKPVGEIYPSLEIMSWCREFGVGLTLGSDAHRPDEVGGAFAEAVALIQQSGYHGVHNLEI